MNTGSMTNGHIEKSQAEKARLTGLYDALRHINRAIVHLQSRDELFEEICRIAVEYGGFACAFFGWIDQETKKIVPIAHSRQGTAYLQDVLMYADERPEGQGPAGRAVRSGRPYISNDFMNDEFTAPWRSKARQHNFWASASFPIRQRDVVVGMFGVYASESGYFQKSEIELLESAAEEVSFALDNFENAKERLAAQETVEKLASIVETSGDAIISISLDGVIRSWNPAAESTFGYTRDEILGKLSSVLTPPEKANEFGEILDRLRAGETVSAFETVRVSKDGGHINVSLTASALRSPDGEVVGVSKIVRDITSRKLTDAALRQSRALVEILLHEAPVALAMVDREMKYLAANRRWLEDLGANETELVGRSHYDVFPNIPETWKDEHRRALAGETVIAPEGSYIASNGGVYWAHRIMRPWMTGDGSIGGLVLMVENINYRKETEETLEREGARLRILFDQASDGMCLFTDDLRLIEANASFGQMLGLPVSGMFERSPWEWDEVHSTREAYLREFPGGLTTPAKFETRIRRDDGSVIDVDVSMTPTEWNGQRFVFQVIRDITERKLAEHELLEAQAKLTAVTENMAEGLIALDQDQHTVIYNLAARSLFGVSESAQSDRDLRTYADVLKVSTLDGTVLPREQWPLSRIQRGEKIQNVEIRAVSQFMGTEKILNCSGGLVPLGANKKLAYGLYQDITERKKAEQELRESDERFQRLVNNSLSVMLLVNPEDGAILYANEAASAFYGYATDRLMSMNIADINCLPRDQVSNEIKSAASAQRTLFHFCHRLASGEIRAVEVYSSGVMMSGKTVLFSIVHDVTERKRAEKELRDSEERYHTTFEQAAVGMTHVSFDGQIIRCNKRFADSLGYTVEEIIGRNFQQLTFKDDWQTGARAVEEVLSGQTESASYEKRYVRKDGSQVWAMLHTSIQRDSEGRSLYLISIVQDIDARKQAEESLQNAQAQLLHTQKMEAIGLLAGGVAHDFNNALSVILGYGEMLERRLAYDEVSSGFVKQILLAENRAAVLTRQLLAFSRKRGHNPITLNLNSVVIDVQEMLRRLIGANVSLTLECAPDLKNINADYGDLEQILMNLAVNARDAMPQGGDLTLRTENVEIGSADIPEQPDIKCGKYVILSVSDTGCGMDKETLDRVFEPFFTTKKRGTGTGLGLSTTYGIVQQSGGHIRVHSVVGAGTRFDVYFPVVEDPIKLIEIKQPVQTAAHGSETILVVDDEEVVRGFVCNCLRENGYNVLDASNGKEAISVAMKNNPSIDLLVTDVMMPEMDGIELAGNMRKTHPDLKVMFISGYAEDLPDRCSGLLQATQLLQKPVNIDTLLTTVRQILLA